MKKIILTFLVFLSVPCFAGKDGDGEFERPWRVEDPFYPPVFEFSGADESTSLHLFDIAKLNEVDISICNPGKGNWAYGFGEKRMYHDYDYFLVSDAQYVYLLTFLIKLNDYEQDRYKVEIKKAKEICNKRDQNFSQYVYRVVGAIPRRIFEQKLENMIKMSAERLELVVSQIELTFSYNSSLEKRSQFVWDYVRQYKSFKSDLKVVDSSFPQIHDKYKSLKENPLLSTIGISHNLDKIPLASFQNLIGIAEDPKVILTSTAYGQKVKQAMDLKKLADRYVKQSDEWKDYQKKFKKIYDPSLFVKVMGGYAFTLIATTDNESSVNYSDELSNLINTYRALQEEFISEVDN